MGLVSRLRERRRRRWSGTADVVPTQDAVQPRIPLVVPDSRSWRQVGAARPEPDGAVQLADSRAEPGGPPVRVDPAMVNPATAERMRPLLRRQRH